MGDHDRDLCNEVLSFLEEYLEQNGYAPTCDEIREAIGLCSRSHAFYYLDVLEKRGQVERKPRSPRGLRLTEPSLMRQVQP